MFSQNSRGLSQKTIGPVLSVVTQGGTFPPKYLKKGKLENEGYIHASKLLGRTQAKLTQLKRHKRFDDLIVFR